METGEVSRKEIQSAIAQAVELRALHSALVQNNGSPANLRFDSSGSPVPYHHHPHHASQLSAQDYPVFTPSYEDEPLPGYRQLQLDSQVLSDYWDGYGLAERNHTGSLSDHRIVNASSRKLYEYPPDLINSEPHTCPSEDQISIIGSGPNDISVLKLSPGYRSSRRNSMGDLKNMGSSCNKCRPATISSDSTGIGVRNTVVVPLTDSHSSIHTQPKNRGLSFLRFLPRLKKKHKNDSKSEDASQVHKDFGIMSIERLKRELVEANESRDAALKEVSEMKSSLGDLKQKLEYLETYCEELRRALREAVHTKNKDYPVLDKTEKFIEENGDNSLPVSEEVMVEGFLQVVSEARLSVKQFCKTLVSHIEETDSSLAESLDSLLQPYKLSISSKYSRAVLYHLEAIINQTLYQDFENPVFVKNGCPKLLDPIQHRQAQFSQFVALRNLSWNEVLRKGTKFYSDEFSRFCDQKMSSIISTLGWTRPWPEQLLQSFFVASKCIWLLHLLAFSFNPALGIIRIEDNRGFDGHYMEDIFAEKQRVSGPSRVKVMVMPGFYVHGRVLKCKVLCRYKSVA